MARTQSELITAVLAELNKLPAGQPAATEDVDAITPRLAPIAADLLAQRVVSVAITLSAIQDFAFPALVRIVAEHCAPMFGRKMDFEALDAAEARLRKVDRLNRAATFSSLAIAVLEQLESWGAGQAAIDGAAVDAQIPRELAALATRNVIYVADRDSVPDPAWPALTRYLAAQFAPKPLPDVARAAEADLRTIQRIGGGTGRKLTVDPALRPRRGRLF